MSKPRYIVAKYIPDLARMEPKNIGVIAWSSAGTAARFVAEKPHNPGELDGRSIPSSVNPALYRQWIGYWRKQLSSPIIKPVCGGEPVSVESDRFLDVLIQTARGNFVLQDGGFLLDELPSGEDIHGFVDYLFTTLVDENGNEEQKDPTLQQLTEDVFSRSRLKSSPQFQSDYVVELELPGHAWDSLKFSHAYQNGDLSLFQKVSFPKQPARLEKNVHATAWRFEKVVSSGKIQKDHGYALVYVTPEQKRDDTVSRFMSVLDSVATCINLGEQDQLEHLVSELDKLRHMEESTP